MEMRYIFLIIAIATLGIITMPSIYSMFTGQHTFYDDTSCLKCHSDIRNELDSSNHHNSLDCEECHVDPTLENSGLAHGNVVMPRCINCHENIENDLISENESHNAFVKYSNSSPFNKGENEACISCHTTRSLDIQIAYADTYQLRSIRGNGEGWQLSDLSKNKLIGEPVSVKYNGTTGIHNVPSMIEFRCEKCHSRERGQLDNSNFHSSFTCDMCHGIDRGVGNGYHASIIPPCSDCHPYNTEETDAHSPFVEKNIEIKNIACSSCHSKFGNKIIYTRPSYIEWDVRDDNGTWLIENLTIGPNKDVEITKNFSDAEIHSISLDGDCINCHKDIRDAVVSGGHSYEIWKKGHDYVQYSDMNIYCISCHRPDTQQGGQSPYPSFPFNLPMHGAIKVTCMDCHGKSDLSANIGGEMRSPPYDSEEMGDIETSMIGQPYFVQSYLCIACKNVGSIEPENGSSINFKIYTEPNVEIYVDGIKSYP